MSTEKAGSEKLINVSIVSHGHGPILPKLLEDIGKYCSQHALHVELTFNIYENTNIDTGQYPFPITVHQNHQSKGFGANHNAAFHRRKCDYFCVLNPDVRLISDPFLLAFRLRGDIGLIAPIVVNTTGRLQPTARQLPTPWRIVGRLFGIKHTDYNMASGVVSPDWVGGMFMLYTYDAYKAVDGFDERFFMYYEDVDICTRLKLRGYAIQADPSVTVIHDGAYSSHRNWRHFRWHVASMIRFFLSPTYVKARWQKCNVNENGRSKSQ